MSDSGLPGYQGLTDDTSEFNIVSFIVQQALARVRTVQLVKVLAVSSGDTGPVGTVDVQIMVNQLDAQGNSTQHGTIHTIPAWRLQGGGNAVVCDPVVGDIGWAGFCDRDISVVKKTKAVGNPGSWRQFDVADGVYIGGFLNGAPTQYWRFSSAGIDARDGNGNTIVMDSSGVKVNGVLFDRSGNVSGVADLTTTGDASLGGGSKKVVLDGDPVSGGAVHATSTKAKAT